MVDTGGAQRGGERLGERDRLEWVEYEEMGVRVVSVCVCVDVDVGGSKC